jgi:hypothetical protein
MLITTYNVYPPINFNDISIAVHSYTSTNISRLRKIKPSSTSFPQAASLPSRPPPSKTRNLAQPYHNPQEKTPPTYYQSLSNSIIHLAQPVNLSYHRLPLNCHTNGTSQYDRFTRFIKSTEKNARADLPATAVQAPQKIPPTL